MTSKNDVGLEGACQRRKCDGEETSTLLILYSENEVLKYTLIPRHLSVLALWVGLDILSGFNMISRV